MKEKAVPIIFFTLIFSVMLMAGSAVLAQEKPCAGDVEKFCQGIQPGGGE